MKKLIAALFVSLVQAGCASAPNAVPLGDPQQDATLKAFVLAPHEAGLFIYRNQSDASDMKTSVQLDGTPLGQMTAMTYLYTPVAPGKHSVTSSAENLATIHVEIAAGELAYIRQEITWQQVEVGVLSAEVGLQLIRPEEGRDGVLECELGAGTATHQAIEVQIEADDPAWIGPLECQASNSFGIWQFAAPGTVTVRPAVAPLQITCNVPAGSEMEASATAPAPGARSRIQAGAQKGAVAGATAGAGYGLAVGVAAAPVMGPLFAVVLAVGSAFQGAELGGVIGALSTGELGADDELVYPSPIAIHVSHMAESN